MTNCGYSGQFFLKYLTPPLYKEFLTKVSINYSVPNFMVDIFLYINILSHYLGLF